MPLDPDMRAVLEVVGFDQMDQLGVLPVDEAVAWLRSGPKPAAASLVRWEDRLLGQVRTRIYWPEGEGPHPILVNFHGGGWVTGSIEGDDLRCQRLALGVGCIVISVDYRLAPEYPFPVPLEDCWAVCQWVHDHAGEIGGDPARMGLSGASAGGNLAAAVSGMAGEKGLPRPVAQVLFYPVTDATAREEGPAGGPYYLTRASMDWYWDRYLQPGQDRSDPRTSPMLAGDFRMAPQTLVITAELDPLAAEARAYAEALPDGQHVEVDGVVHGFVSLVPDHRKTLQAMEIACEFLKGAFRS